ncbi:uncharacterized protein DS421_19g663310 [Arachis hypogaea]|uniref:Aminotransferase-like plant mobile domain-containing protein n=1 Tax=Arachis hypogaea TaxID=3818 RepID=A0A6B9VEU9_ARAHY|nr:uncharacterized protein DS421_19g663310 [Arachis hypogaea]
MRVHGGAPRCQTAPSSAAGCVEKGVVQHQDDLAQGPSPAHASDHQSGHPPTVHQRSFMGSAVLAWTYHSLCHAKHRDTTDIADCTPLLMSWIYHMFPQWCPEDMNIPTFPLVFIGMSQQIRDYHAQRVLRWSTSLDRLALDELPWTPYADPWLQDITPDWVRSTGEWRTWLSVIPFVCFNIVEFHQSDRVKRQFGGEQTVPVNPVNVNRFLTIIGRGEDVWWPTKLREWYGAFKARFEVGHMITIQPIADDRPTLE